MDWLFQCRSICIMVTTVVTFVLVYLISVPVSFHYQTTFSSFVLKKSGTYQFKFNSITKVYESDGKPIIWQYWHTEHMPLYVRLFTEALHCRNPEFKIIVAHQSDVYQILPNLDVPEDLFKSLKAGHQADIFRLAVLFRYGGVYTDIDVYPLDKIYPLYKLLPNYDLVIGESGENNFAQAGMGPTKAGVNFFQVWHENQLEALMSYFPDGESYENLTSPIPWMFFLYFVESGLDKVIASNKSKILRFDGKLTNDQLIVKGFAQSSHMPWRETSPRFLPLNWTPYLFAYGLAMRELFADFTKIKQLLPEEETIYSAFIGCALLDCEQEYAQLSMSGIKETPTANLDLLEVLEALERVNRSICDSIRVQPQKFPIFDLDKYILR